MDNDYRGITVEISSIPVVTPQQTTPSPQYYRKFQLQNRGIPAVTAVLPPFPLPCRALQHTQQQPSYGPLSVTTRVSRYQKKHSPAHHPDHHPNFISFFHLLRSIASSLFKLCAWLSFGATSLHVLFGLPLVGLEPSTSYSIHIFTQSASSFAAHTHTIATCFAVISVSSIPSLSLSSLLGTLSFTLTLHIHLTILISARWSATSFSFLTGQVPLPCSIQLRKTAIQPPSPNQWYIPIGKQWYQLPEFIPSNSDSGLHNCISISIHTQHITLVAELIHYLQICTGTNIHTCMTCTDYRIRATSTNKWPHHFVPCYPLYHLTSSVPTCDN